MNSRQTFFFCALLLILNLFAFERPVLDHNHQNDSLSAGNRTSGFKYLLTEKKSEQLSPSSFKPLYIQRDQDELTQSQLNFHLHLYTRLKLDISITNPSCLTSVGSLSPPVLIVHS